MVGMTMAELIPETNYTPRQIGRLRPTENICLSETDKPSKYKSGLLTNYVSKFVFN